MRYLLDTSAILAHYRQELGWDRVQGLFESSDAELFAASVSLTELGRRLRELGAGETDCHAALSAYQLLFAEIVAVDAATALAALAISYSVPARLPLVDALITAAAQARQAVLVHRDEHMRSIPSDILDQLDLSA